MNNNNNNVNTFYLLWVAKYNIKQFQNLQDLKETGEDLIIFKFKLARVKEQVFVSVSVNSFMVGVQQAFIKWLNHVSYGCN